MSDDILTSYGSTAEKPLVEREPGWSLPIEHLSPSSMGMARRCLEQFRRRYILGERERPGESAVVGSIFHEALDFNYQQKVESHADIELVEALEYLNDVAVQTVVEERGGEDEIEWDPGHGVEDAREDAQRIFAAYYRVVVPRVQPISTEARIEVWPVQLPVKLLGYIDTETHDRIIDAKTGKRATTSIKPSWRLQADVYAHVTKKPVEYHTVSRAKTPTITTPAERGDDLVVYPLDGHTEQLFNVLGQLARIIEHCWLTYGPDEPWPTTGRIGDFTQNKLACDFCGWRKSCVAWKD